MNRRCARSRRSISASGAARARGRPCQNLPPAPFYTGGSVRRDVPAPATREIFTELDRMRTSDVTADELKTAKDAFARSLPGLFETTAQTVGTLSQLFVYNLPLDYYR